MAHSQVAYLESWYLEKKMQDLMSLRKDKKKAEESEKETTRELEDEHNIVVAEEETKIGPKVEKK